MKPQFLQFLCGENLLDAEPVRCLNVSDVLAERADQFAHSLVHGRRQVLIRLHAVRVSDTGISVQLSGDSNSIDLNLVGYDFEFLDESAANIPREETPAHPVYVRGLRANRGPGENTVHSGGCGHAVKCRNLNALMDLWAKRK